MYLERAIGELPEQLEKVEMQLQARKEVETNRQNMEKAQNRSKS